MNADDARMPPPDATPAPPTPQHEQAAAVDKASDAALAAVEAAQAEPPDAEQRVANALARVQASRAALREVLYPPPRGAAARRAAASAAGAPEAGAPDGWSERLAERWQSLRDNVTGQPAVLLAMDAAQGWWQRHPLRPLVDSLLDEVREAVSPVVRRHPIASVAASALLAAALVVMRPWRHPLLARHVHDAPRKAGRWLTHQLAQPSVQSMLAGLVVTLAASRKTSHRPPAEPQAAAAPTGAADPHAGAADPSSTPAAAAAASTRAGIDDAVMARREAA